MMFPANLMAIGSSIGTALIVGILAFGLHSCDVNRLKANQAKELADQETTLNAECMKDKQIPNEVSNDYQNALSNLNGQLSLRLHDNPFCIVPTASDTTSGPHETTSRGELRTPDGTNVGVKSTSLRTFSGECEKVRLQVIYLQSFIKKTWAAKGQPVK